MSTSEHPPSELAVRSRVIARRSIGSPILFTIVYSSLASAVYFSLGVIAGHALGLTPLVFLVAAVMYTVTAMTYVEGASLHQDRGGSTVFARYAFNELVSFIAGWAILLDYVILVAVTCYSATQYLKVFWHPLGNSGAALGLSLAFVALVVLSNIRGFGGRRATRVGILLAGDLLLQALIVVLGLVLFFNPHTLTGPIHLGTAPTWSRLVFALTVAVISFTSLESASGLAGEVRISRAGLKRLVASTTATVAFLYVGIALVAVTALPVRDGRTELSGRYLDAPVIGIVERVHPHWLGQTLMYLVAAMAAVTLVAAANSAMLGLSRLAYSLSTWRRPRTSTSSSASTPSAPRSRSRSRTCRSAACATQSPTATGPIACRCRSPCAAGSCRCRRCSARSSLPAGSSRCLLCMKPRAMSASAGWPSGLRCT
jgi:APA family basic amino acid/polyamine antiporter